MVVFKKPFLLSVICCVFSIAVCSQALPSSLQRYIRSIKAPDLGIIQPVTGCKKISTNLYYIDVVWEHTQTLTQKNLEIKIAPSFQPEFHWAPHLTPDSSYVIAQHVFRSPALIVANRSKTVSIIPDLNIIKEGTSIPWYMDMNATDHYMSIGMGTTVVREHVLYGRGDAS